MGNHTSKPVMKYCRKRAIMVSEPARNAYLSGVVVVAAGAGDAAAGLTSVEAAAEVVASEVVPVLVFASKGALDAAPSPFAPPLKSVTYQPDPLS